MFENIVGNDKIKELLQNSIKNKKVSHSYLFIGQEGIGKKMIAMDFAKAILCLDEKSKYCNVCKSCIEFDSNNNPDFKILEPDGNSIKIEQIRELQSKIIEKPIISSKKVYIINDSDKMTKEAQNCLLKTLEEPPEFATIILIGANESAYLSTIKSRCMILHFENIQDEKLKEILKNKFNQKLDNEMLLKFSQGSISRAINIIENKEIYEKIEEIISNIHKKDIIEIMKMSEIIYKSKEIINDILENINIQLMELSKKSYVYLECIDIVENTKKRLKMNANYDMCIDNMLLQMKEKLNI